MKTKNENTPAMTTTAPAETVKKDVVSRIDAEARLLTIDFSNGKTIAVLPDAMGIDIQVYAMLHGLKQKIVDATAISRNTVTGGSASIEDKYQAAVTVFDQLMSGAWNKTRAKGEGQARGGLLLLAVCRMKPTQTVEQVREWLEGLGKDQIAALKLNKRVAAAMLEIQAERASVQAIDSDSLLDEL